MNNLPCPQCTALIPRESLRCRICGHRLTLDSNLTGVSKGDSDGFELPKSPTYEELSEMLPREFLRQRADDYAQIALAAKQVRGTKFKKSIKYIILLISLIVWVITVVYVK
ncbi:unannotated protein [freshwater metagenome]|uniref:Unannotated protein n=1 Tax=freshwater metagenome TaxID=449393 RepID=A0A6J7D7V5_9ZZZZ